MFLIVVTKEGNVISFKTLILFVSSDGNYILVLIKQLAYICPVEGSIVVFNQPHHYINWSLSTNLCQNNTGNDIEQ
jgi:hypothetical protein